MREVPRKAVPRLWEPLKVLARVVQELELVAGHSLEEYRSSVYVRRSSERLVQLGVDLSCEIACGLLFQKSGRLPTGYEEAFHELGREGILSKALTEKLAAAATLRREILYEAEPGNDEGLHKRLSYLAVLFREFGRQTEEIVASKELVRT
jgi:uncharacterized protein YutE (UPF0331/DUF86 family)